MTHRPLRALLARFISMALLALAVMHSPPAEAGFTVYCSNEPARRCETFTEFVQFVATLQRGRLQRVEADADMPAANIYSGDVFALAFGGALLPTHIDASTPFGEVLHQEVYRFIAGIQRRNLFLKLQKEPFDFMQLDELTLARWEVLDAGYDQRPWMDPVTEAAKMEQKAMQERDITPGPPPRQNGFDFGLTTIIPHMFSQARQLVLGHPAESAKQCNCPGTRLAASATRSRATAVTLVDPAPDPQPQVDIWQAGVMLHELLRRSPQPQALWPGSGDPFAESQYGAPRMLWQPPPLGRTPWWKRPIQFVLRSIRP
jgi:hypothetical protein